MKMVFKSYHKDHDFLHVGCEEPRAYFIPYETKEKALAGAIKTMLGINPKVHLVAPKTIKRSEGKAVRCIDRRKLHD